MEVRNRNSHETLAGTLAAEWTIVEGALGRIAKKEAAGGGAGRRGHGVMEVQTLSRLDCGGTQPLSPECTSIMPVGDGAVYRPDGSIRSGTEVPSEARS